MRWGLVMVAVAVACANDPAPPDAETTSGAEGTGEVGGDGAAEDDDGLDSGDGETGQTGPDLPAGGSCTTNADCPLADEVCDEVIGMCIPFCPEPFQIPVEGRERCLALIPPELAPTPEWIDFVQVLLFDEHVPGPTMGPQGEPTVDIDENACAGGAIDGWRWHEWGSSVELCGIHCSEEAIETDLTLVYWCPAGPG